MTFAPPTLPVIFVFPPAIVVILIFNLILLPFIFQAYYRFVKFGIVLMIKEGVPVYMFANRKYINRVNALCRQLTIARENRVREIKKMH
jgi:hypothetical protein